MRVFLLFLLGSIALSAQSVSFYVDNSNGSSPTTQLQPFPSNYSFPDTPIGASSSVTIRLVNSSSSSINIAALQVLTAQNSGEQSQEFTNTLPTVFTLAPQAWKLFTLSFAPIGTTAGPMSGYMQIGVNGVISGVASLAGNATTPQIALTCAALSTPQAVSQCDGATLQSASSTPINFGNVLTTTSAAIQFTLTNNGSGTLDPQSLISLTTPIYNSNQPFSISPAALPTTLASGSSLNFTVTFAPGDTSTTETTLNVGPNSYLLQGTGTSSVVGDISSLLVSYLDPSCVCTRPAQPATPINFGQTVAGTGTNTAFTFTITNPQTTIDPVVVPTLAVSGSGFTISGAPTLPATIQPGQSITFQLTFSASATGTYSGTLSIGSRQFSLEAQSVPPLISGVTFQVDGQPLLSQQQAHLSIQLATAPSSNTIGTLTLQFAPSVNNIANDPAINFTATGGRQLQVTVPAGSQNVTYNGQSALTFQTGTTAGTITFTLSFPNTPDFTQSYTISPAKVQITTSQAVQQSPNLVVTLTGYDNTYSTGALSFTFYGTTGQLLTPTAIQVNAAPEFQQYFFGSSNQAGGAFSLQATFPVSGDATQVGSVTVNLSNSIGQTTVSQPF